MGLSVGISVGTGVDDVSVSVTEVGMTVEIIVVGTMMYDVPVSVIVVGRTVGMGVEVMSTVSVIVLVTIRV